MKSCLYTGWVRHRRFVPVDHHFRYPIFMFYLDLDELDQVFKKKWYASLERFNAVSFRRKDYFNPKEKDLKTAVINKVNSELAEQGVEHKSIVSVRMLTHLRLFNFTFNPVTFYYCFDEQDNLVFILSEITNTPWDERHAYVLPIGQGKQHSDYAYQTKGNNKHAFQFEKAFHVSPFNPMNMQYDWVFSEPTEKLHVHMDNTLVDPSAMSSLCMSSGGVPKSNCATPFDGKVEKHFDATLTMEKRELSSDLGKTLIQQPLMTVKVVMGIYWQAFKLWVKKAPFYDHPDTTDVSNNSLNEYSFKRNASNDHTFNEESLVETPLTETIAIKAEKRL